MWSWAKFAAGVVSLANKLMAWRTRKQYEETGAAKQRERDHEAEREAREWADEAAREIRTVDDATARARRRLRE